MLVNIFATSVGDARFAKIVYESHEKNSRLALPQDVQVDFRFIIDVKVPIDQKPFFAWADPRIVIEDDRDRGVNAIWARCVEMSQNADICVVMNDDLYLTPGWLYAVVEVLSNNPHVGLCGISCDDVTFQARQKNIKERWFCDPDLFSNGDSHLSETIPLKYEPWPSGICWATKPKLWLAAGGIDPGLWLSYGEMDMGRKMFKSGYYTVGIYTPTIYHFGGGSSLQHEQPGFCERVDHYAHYDRYRFETMYGHAHAHLWLEPWTKEVMATSPPELVFDEGPVRRLYG